MKPDASISQWGRHRLVKGITTLTLSNQLEVSLHNCWGKKEVLHLKLEGVCVSSTMRHSYVLSYPLSTARFVFVNFAACSKDQSGQVLDNQEYWEWISRGITDVQTLSCSAGLTQYQILILA